MAGVKKDRNSRKDVNSGQEVARHDIWSTARSVLCATTSAASKTLYLSGEDQTRSGWRRGQAGEEDFGEESVGSRLYCGRGMVGVFVEVREIGERMASPFVFRFV